MAPYPDTRSSNTNGGTQSRSPPPPYPGTYQTHTTYNDYGPSYGTIPTGIPVFHRRRPRCIPLLMVALLIAATVGICSLVGRNVNHPRGSYWSTPADSRDCSAVGIREVTAVLQDIPQAWLNRTVEACHLTSLSLPISEHKAGRISRSPDRCTVQHHNDASTVVGAWDIEDSSCMPTWYPLVPEDCVDIERRAYSAQVQYIPPGLTSHDACENAPVLIGAEGSELEEKHCSLSEDGTFVAHGTAHSDYCKPSLSSKSESTCSAVGERDYVSEINVPAGLDPMLACRNTTYSVHDVLTPPRRCMFSSEGTKVAGFWHISNDTECTPVWETMPLADRQCYAYGTRRYTSTMRPVPTLDMHSVCLQTPATVKEDTVMRPNACVERANGHIEGVWLVDFDEPGCISELKQVQDKGCSNGLRHVEAVVENASGDRWNEICMTTPLNWGGIKHLPRNCVGSWFQHLAFYDFEDKYCF